MERSRHMIRSRGRITVQGVAFAVLLGLASACGGSGTSATPTTTTRTVTTAPARPPKQFPVGDAAFRTIPDPIPAGRHGDLLRYQKVANPPDGLRWYRIMYLSATLSGKPTVETGMLTIPDKPTPPGGWKLATHGHGSTGLADDCAPSRTIDTNRASAAELMVVGADAAKSNYVVVSTDYEGQGGPGRHPFLVGESEGRAMLDAARAARQFPGVQLPETLAIVGYSQGGHAALWANQIASHWTPEFHVLGTMAGAPASELRALLTSSSKGSVVDNPQALGVVAGFAAADPGLQRDLDEILAPAGRKLLAVMDRSCTPPKGFNVGRPLLTADPRTTQPWKRLLAENTPGSIRTESPILIIHSQGDENVPIAQSAALLARLCSHGQMAERRVLDSGGHVATAVPAYEQGFQWLDGLIAGRKPVSSCTR